MSDLTPAAARPVGPPPLPLNRLKQIATDACTLTLSTSTGYEHARTESWNSAIINHILRALISESTPTPSSTPNASVSTPASPPWKFAVNSTIIQHLGAGGEGGRRGMHSACGAYWNNEKDGMWSFKHEMKGLDVVVSVVWIAI